MSSRALLESPVHAMGHAPDDASTAADLSAVIGPLEADEVRFLLAQGSDPGDEPVWQPVGRYGRTSEWVKGALDRMLASLGLVALSPLLGLIAVAVRLDSPGPVLFRQTRIGRGGRAFTFYKFRGMFTDARERFPDLYDYRYSAEEIQKLRFHGGHDPRVTRVGAFIRRTSLDELPNLINVVLGDMGLVGPRPEIPELIPYYESHAKTVLGVKPGITSLAKWVGRDDLTFQETLELDLRYVRERCLRMDLAILFGTVWKIVAGRLRGH